MLRLAIHTGIGNITDNHILSSMTVKDSVWKWLAEHTWAELTAWWPATLSFEPLAGEHSATWQQLTGAIFRRAIRERQADRAGQSVPADRGRRQ
ncbi:TPA: hypothetical protein LVL70_003756 [Klebsiella michiganensis]|nr:hypothetical protein [Klebsiella michiganensis]